MAKITKHSDPNTIRVKTTQKTDQIVPGSYKWWTANSQRDLAQLIIASSTFLKKNQLYRYRQASVFSRLYGNMPLSNFIGSSLYKPNMGNQLPIDRPTMNVVQSCIDTLVSRITQSRPRPVFLTDGSDYKQRNIAKQMNSFINGELYQMKAHELGKSALRDGCILGTGICKIYETYDNKVGLDRVLEPELLVDPNDAFYGYPRQLFQLKLIDRDCLAEQYSEKKSVISSAEQGFLDESNDGSETISDQIIAVEAWHLPSGKDATDGRHSLVCSSGVIFDEEWKKDRFPFVFLPYSSRQTGIWGQSLSEQLMGTQVEINKLLMTITASINLVGVPRVFVEDGSKVVKAHLNNQIGSIVTYRGTKPSYEIAPCMPQEIYGQLERLVQYAYQQSGISALAATSQKPAGLNSGEAIRNYDDLQSDRFADISRRYDTLYVDMAYLIIDKAKEIAERDGKYQTVYPNKNGTQEIDLPSADIDDKFIIQCFDASSLPRDPSGRLQKIVEMMQAGLVSPSEGRRLLDYPDIEQVEKLANAGEERILQILDQIVDKGKYTPPDPFMDLQLANTLCTQYYNLYAAAKLEESRADLLRTFSTQVKDLLGVAQQAMPPQPQSPQGQPQAVPEAPQTSPMLPNAPQGRA